MQEFPTLELNIGTDFERTRNQVEAIVAGIAPRHDMGRITRVFNLLASAYDGRLPGWQRLQTLYHNHLHTLEVVLCAARLLHGMHLAGEPVTGDLIDWTVMGALLHDVGYLKRDDENEGTGAQFTPDHVVRGTEFARAHLVGEPPAFVNGLANVILITDHRLPASRLDFGSEEERQAAFVAGTADLVSQMANREYLERLLLLYFEFREAGMGDYRDFDELLEKTAAFYRETQERLERELGGLSRYLARHFEQAEGIAVDRYQESIDKNLAYLDRILQRQHGRRIEMLKRGGIVGRALKKLADS